MMEGVEEVEVVVVHNERATRRVGDVATRNRSIAEAALRPWTPKFTHGDLDVIRAWWSMKSLLAVRWLVEHGFDPSPEVAVLRSQP